jgi:DNA gyrase subunit B
MNAGQLWSTTMDPANRILKQVKIEDAVYANEIFEKLMGENVDARRDFIRRHAKEVNNLDV